MKQSNGLPNSLEQTCQKYQAAMDERTRDYLHDRGLPDPVIASFRLGTVAGFGEHAIYRGQLAIPYLTELAGVVGFKFRRPHHCTPQCEHEKYLTPYPTRIYNAPAFAKAERLGYVAICEGEFDAMVLDGLCGIPAVAVPGVKTWQQHREWPLLFQGYSRVLIFQDQDKDREVTVDGKKNVINPGRDLSKAILADVPAAEVVDVEGLGCKDVNEIFLAHGRDAIREVAGV